MGRATSTTARAVRTAGAAVAAGAIVAGVALVPKVQLGDLPTWVAAVGASIAAVFAFWQLASLREQVRLQQDQLKAQADDLDRVREVQRQQVEVIALEIRDRREVQARQIQIQRFVMAWSPPGGGVQNSFVLILHVRNRSGMSISDVDAFFGLDSSTPRRADYTASKDVLSRVRNPGDSPPSAADMGHLPRERLDTDEELNCVGPSYDQETAGKVRSELHFTDASGRHWKVDHNGALFELPDRTPPYGG